MSRAPSWSHGFLLLLSLGLAACSSTEVPPATLGKPCIQSTDCSQGERCTQSIDFPSHVCARPCVLADDGCPDHYRCAALQSGPYCVPNCFGDADCPTGTVCRTEADGFLGACIAEETVPGSCPFLPHLVEGEVAGPPEPPAGCQKPVVDSALPDERVQHLGVHPVNDEVPFEVPSGTQGVSIVQQAVDAGETLVYQGIPLPNAAVPLRITGPSGEVLYDDFDAGGPPEDQYVFVGFPAPVENVVGIPNSSASLADVAARGGLPAGTWHLTVNDWANECDAINAGFADAGCDGGSAPGIYDVTVLTQPGARSGRMDVSLYLVNSGGLTAKHAVTDPSVLRMVRTMDELYAKQGVCLGTVTVHDLPEWARSKYATVNADELSPCDDLYQLFTLSEPVNTLHLFLVQSITSEMSGGFSIVGLDGTVPGPSSLGGSVFSGAVVSSADLASDAGCGSTRSYLGCGPDFVGYVAAHEGGHWLGLFHTTEGDGEYFDPLRDTPTCSCEACAPSNEVAGCGGLPDGGITYVTGSTCDSGGATCGGADNLMFWLLDSNGAGALTPEQGQVMRTNVLVQ
jgi:hypothetical protein